MQFTDLQDTIVALATPAGAGAIGIIRLSGQEAISIVNTFFAAKDLQKVPSHSIHLGYIRNESHQIIDQALVSVFKTPHSYTKENIIEISCHGSQYILQQLLELCCRRGARMAREGEFTMRAFLNGQMDLSQAEAVADLIAAESASAHQMALKQMRGGFSEEIKKLREELVHFASMIELELDFGEEDVEFADRQDLQELVSKILQLLRHLSDSFQLGNAIKNGVNTVLAGRPNAGKSTLLNALLNEERAIVSDIAGTTRDTIEEILNIQGLQFRLIDTAGIRQAGDQIEAIGVQKTLEEVKKSAILLYVYDYLQTNPAMVQKDIEALLTDSMQLILVANKYDQYEQLDETQKYDHDRRYDTEGWRAIEAAWQNRYQLLHISAKSKEGIEQIKTQLYDLIASGKTNNQSTIVSNTRHYTALQSAIESLDSVLNGLEIGITGDFLAMDIRHALNALGEITGEISTDDLLGNIFSRFCIGK